MAATEEGIFVTPRKRELEISSDPPSPFTQRQLPPLAEAEYLTAVVVAQQYNFSKTQTEEEKQHRKEDEAHPCSSTRASNDTPNKLSKETNPCSIEIVEGEDSESTLMPSQAAAINYDQSRQTVERLIKLGLAGPEDLYDYDAPYQSTVEVGGQCENDTEKLIPIDIPDEMLLEKKEAMGKENKKSVRINCEDSDSSSSDDDGDPELGLGGLGLGAGGAKKETKEKKKKKKRVPPPPPPTFWDHVSALRRTKYGIAAWMIGWNLIALLLMRREFAKTWTFIPVCTLGFSLIASGWHAHKVSKRRRYRGLITLVPIALAQTAFSVAMLKCQWHLAMGNTNIEMSDVFEQGPYQVLVNYMNHMKPAMFFAIGNIILLLFVFHTGVTTVRLVVLRFGDLLDEFAEKLGLADAAVKDEDEEENDDEKEPKQNGKVDSYGRPNPVTEEWILEQLRKTGFL